jgi:hypothetical protein
MLYLLFCPSFSTLQTLFSALSFFITNVLFLFYHSFLVLLICSQKILSISNDDTHHIMIGIFLLSAILTSNIFHSNNPHPG